MTLRGHSKKLKRESGYIKFIPLSENYIEPKKSDQYAIGFDVYAHKTPMSLHIQE